MKLHASLLLATCVAFAGSLRADTLADPAVQAKVDAKIAVVRQWAAAPVIVNTVLAQNAALPPERAAMTQEKWKVLSLRHPFVRGLVDNAVVEFLKEKHAANEWLTEAFLSDAGGFKVAFLTKTSSWCHAGSAKHVEPMNGHVWQGKIEIDESVGGAQLQVSVPVLSEGKPIGSLVIGFDPLKL